MRNPVFSMLPTPLPPSRPSGGYAELPYSKPRCERAALRRILAIEFIEQVAVSAWTSAGRLSWSHNFGILKKKTEIYLSIALL